MMKRHRLGQVRVDTNESYRTATEKPAAEFEGDFRARGIGMLKGIKKEKQKSLDTVGVVRDVCFDAKLVLIMRNS